MREKVPYAKSGEVSGNGRATPGTYTLRATLPGFVTVRRTEVELSGSQTLTIPIEMRVGDLEETITVAGETLVVDVQSARRELVLNADVVQRFRPRATPGVNVSDAGLSPTMTSFSARSRGANANSVGGEGRYTVNGMTVSAAQRRPLVVRLYHGEHRRSLRRDTPAEFIGPDGE